MQNFAFTIIGGDLRMSYLAQMLSNDGHLVKIYGQEENDFPFTNEIIHCSDLETAFLGSDICLLGMPSTRDAKTVYAPFSSKAIIFEQLLPYLDDLYCLFGCQLPKLNTTIPVIDYTNDEALTIFNTLPTAEGALQLLMENTDITVFNSNIALTGFGRVSQQAARLLNAVGAEITIFARSPKDLTHAQICGYTARHIQQLVDHISEYDVLINTVPAQIISADILLRAAVHTRFMELASAPGGFDMSAIKERNLIYIPAPGLPGKVAPQSAALYIKNTISKRLEELS